MTIRRGKRKGEVVANLRDDTRVQLERLGRERALIYKTLVLTGLRKGELASTTVGQLELDTDPAYLVLKAADEKNREGSTIPLTCRSSRRSSGLACRKGNDPTVQKIAR